MLTSLRSHSSSWPTSLAAPAANPRRGRSPFVRGLVGLALVLPLTSMIIGCNTDVGDTAANVILNIDTIVLESAPWGDVLSSSQIILDDTISHQQILRTCFDQGIRLESFDHKEPTLHDVFIELVGEDAKEVTLR